MELLIGAVLVMLGLVAGFFLFVFAFQRGWDARDNLGITRGEQSVAPKDKHEYGGAHVLDGEKPKSEPANP